MPQPSIYKICLKIIYLKFHSDILGANELMIPYGVSELGPHWFRWLVTYSALSHHLNQCWLYQFGPLGTYWSKISFESQIFSFKKLICSCLSQIHWNQVWSREWRCSWTGDAPTTSKWSTILLCTVRLILRVWQYIGLRYMYKESWQ